MDIRKQILELIEEITPFDALEKSHQQAVCQWIKSKEEIFRLKKPATPPKHLVSYFLPVDVEQSKVLLTDHKKSGLWVPPGGHVDPNEHPKTTVEREAQEELFINPLFISSKPLFITQTKTVGSVAGHIDVSLWYLIEGDCEKKLQFDEREFSKIQWFSLDEIPFSQSDPHMERFIHKLQKENFLKPALSKSL